MDKLIRLDKWLWTMRFYKTRSLATDACKRELISVNEIISKSSKEIKPHDIITINYRHYTCSFKIIEIGNNRIAAKLVSNYILDVTSDVEVKRKEDYLLHQQSTHHTNTKPEKKERKQIRGFLDGN